MASRAGEAYSSMRPVHPCRPHQPWARRRGSTSASRFGSAARLPARCESQARASRPGSRSSTTGARGPPPSDLSLPIARNLEDGRAGQAAMGHQGALDESRRRPAGAAAGARLRRRRRRAAPGPSWSRGQRQRHQGRPRARRRGCRTARRRRIRMASRPAGERQAPRWRRPAMRTATVPAPVSTSEPRRARPGGRRPALAHALDAPDRARVHEPHAGCVALPPEQADDVVRRAVAEQLPVRLLVVGNRRGARRARRSDPAGTGPGRTGRTSGSGRGSARPRRAGW